MTFKAMLDHVAPAKQPKLGGRRYKDTKKWSEQKSKLCLTLIVFKLRVQIFIIIFFFRLPFEIMVRVSPDFAAERAFLIWKRDGYALAEIVSTSAG